MKIENKLGLSWAKLSHLNSIELRSTAFSRLSCSWKSQTELVCYKMCIFQQVKYKKADVKRIHIVDWNIYVIFINHLDHLKKIFHFLVVDSTKISQINTSLHQITCQKCLLLMFSLIVSEEMAYLGHIWGKFCLL